MDFILLKSFLPEIFLSFAILSQLLFNIRIINNLNFNFPILDKELCIQVFFILICLLSLFTNLKIEGVLSNFLFVNDEASRVIKIFFIITCLILLIFIFRSFLFQRLNFFEFFSIFLFSVFSSLLLVSSVDFLSAYLCIEMQALSFYILASFNRNSTFSTEAGLKYFIMGSFISCIFLLGASFIYGVLGTLNFNAINLLLIFPFEIDLVFAKFFIILGSLLIIITLFFKISAAPFHFWSPDVYEGSPLSSTLIFSVLPKLVVLTFLTRWIYTTSAIFSEIHFFFLVSGILSVIIGTFFALKQKRLKRLIIFSSIAQIGFILIALSSNSFEGYISQFFFLIVYIVTSILIWGHFVILQNSQALQSTFYNKEQSSLFLSNLAGLYSLNKYWSFSFVLIFFSVAGIPPLTGFLSKLLIILSVVNSNQTVFAAILVAISAISVFYYIRIIKIIYFEGTKTSLNQNKILSLIDSKADLFDVDCFIFALLLFFLIFLFFYPTFLLLLSQYIVLNLLGV